MCCFPSTLCPLWRARKTNKAWYPSQTICVTFIQCWTNVEDVVPTLYKCYTNVLCLLGSRAGQHWFNAGQKSQTLAQNWTNSECYSVFSGIFYLRKHSQVCAMQSQKAVAAYFSSEQLLYFTSTDQCGSDFILTCVANRWLSVELMVNQVAHHSIDVCCVFAGSTVPTKNTKLWQYGTRFIPQRLLFVSL